MTHFLQAQFNQARLPCGLNSCILFYFVLLSMAQAYATCWGKLRKCGLEGMGRFLLDFLHEPRPCVLPSGQETLIASQAHEGGLVSKISTLKQFLCSGWLWPKVSVQTLFSFKHNWLPLANSICWPSLRWASQWFEISNQRQPIKENPLYFQNHAKSIRNSSLNKNNPSQNTKIVS